MAEVRIDVYYDWRCRRCGTTVYGPIPEFIAPGGDHDVASHRTLYLDVNNTPKLMTCAARASEGEKLGKTYVAVMKALVPSAA